jgi:hypothetical protein
VVLVASFLLVIGARIEAADSLDWAADVIEDHWLEGLLPLTGKMEGGGEVARTHDREPWGWDSKSRESAACSARLSSSGTSQASRARRATGDGGWAWRRCATVTSPPMRLSSPP